MQKLTNSLTAIQLLPKLRGGHESARQWSEAAESRSAIPQLAAGPTSLVRVLLSCDQFLVRASLKSLIAEFSGIEVLGETGNEREAFEQAARLEPNVVIVHIAMLDLIGLDAICRLTKDYPEVPVVVVSTHANASHVFQVLRAGALGYVPESSAPGELEMAIKAAAHGEIFLSPAIAKHVVDVYLEGYANHFAALTPREGTILQLVAGSKTSKQIARLLNTSIKTVESHRARLMKRLDLHGVADLVRYAVDHGLISSER